MLRHTVSASAAFGQKYEASGFVPGDKLLLNSGFWPQALTSAHFTLFHQSEVKTLGTFSGSACHSNVQPHPPRADERPPWIQTSSTNIISAFSVTTQCDVGTFYLQINTLGPWQQLCEVCFQSFSPPPLSPSRCAGCRCERVSLALWGPANHIPDGDDLWDINLSHGRECFMFQLVLSKYKRGTSWDCCWVLPCVLKRCSHMEQLSQTHQPLMHIDHNELAFYLFCFPFYILPSLFDPTNVCSSALCCLV